MSRLRNLFERLSLREKVLLNLFLWVIVLLWISDVTGDLRVALNNYSAQQEELTFFEERLEEKPVIETALEDLQNRFDRDRTRDSTELQGHIASLLNRNGLTPRNLRARTQEGDVFNWHEMSLGVEDASLINILGFEAEVRAESPYVNVERVILRGSRRNEELVYAEFDINSFELKTAETAP